MKKGVLLTCVITLGLVLLLAPSRARAEFCPARVQSVASVNQEPGAYAVRLAADSPRTVTGAFLVETAAGWFRAPFAPVRLAKTNDGIVSPFIALELPRQPSLKNVWLAQAASDDPLWQQQGTVACAPEPERRVPSNSVARTQLLGATNVSAVPIPAPLSYRCAKPFAEAEFQGDVMDGVPYAPGEFATALVDIDANGRVLGVTPIDAAGGDFTLRNEIKQRVMHMPVTPATAYCRPVPSSYLLREGVPAQ